MSSHKNLAIEKANLERLGVMAERGDIELKPFAERYRKRRLAVLEEDAKRHAIEAARPSKMWIIVAAADARGHRRVLESGWGIEAPAIPRGAEFIRDAVYNVPRGIFRWTGSALERYPEAEQDEFRAGLQSEILELDAKVQAAKDAERRGLPVAGARADLEAELAKALAELGALR